MSLFRILEMVVSRVALWEPKRAVLHFGSPFGLVFRLFGVPFGLIFKSSGVVLGTQNGPFWFPFWYPFCGQAAKVNIALPSPQKPS